MKELKFNDEMKLLVINGLKTMTRRPFLINGNAITHTAERIEKFLDGSFHYFSIGGMSGPYKCPYGKIGTVFKVDGVAFEITYVRVERVQVINQEDLIKEGFIGLLESSLYMGERLEKFVEIWDSIYFEKYPWNSNPWVWVIEFKKVEVSA